MCAVKGTCGLNLLNLSLNVKQGNVTHKLQLLRLFWIGRLSYLCLCYLQLPLKANQTQQGKHLFVPFICIVKVDCLSYILHFCCSWFMWIMRVSLDKKMLTLMTTQMKTARERNIRLVLAKMNWNIDYTQGLLP